MKKNKIGGNQNRKKRFGSNYVEEYYYQRNFVKSKNRVIISLNHNKIGTYFGYHLVFIESFYKVKINP